MREFAFCSGCGKYARGSSPTGDWCNACGWMEPCPCWVKEQCPFHHGHLHDWTAEGRCGVLHCPAKKEFQE